MWCCYAVKTDVRDCLNDWANIWLKCLYNAVLSVHLDLNVLMVIKQVLVINAYCDCKNWCVATHRKTSALVKSLLFLISVCHTWLVYLVISWLVYLMNARCYVLHCRHYEENREVTARPRERAPCDLCTWRSHDVSMSHLLAFVPFLY